MMETSFYHDSDNTNREAIKRMKSTMTLPLDFADQSSKKKDKLGSVLASPDLNMLKLASPELERMIIAQNGMVTTTPTPSQFICPSYVTDEQEAYARGFVDALEELQNKNHSTPPPPQAQTEQHLSMNTTAPVAMVTTAPVVVAPSSAPYTTTTSLPGSVLPTAVSQMNMMPPTSMQQQQHQQRHQVATPPMVAQVKEEVQIVPCLGNTPPISPIDMNMQEQIKVERKRERNRLAARKYRTRKLERISRLEERVAQLKGENSNLQDTANSLREQLCQLKKQIMDHVNSGCQVMLTQNLL